MSTKDGRTRVVITGMGPINPLGKNLEEYWDGLIEGRSTARTVEGTYPTDKLPSQYSSRFLPSGLIVPMPVMTTRVRPFSLVTCPPQRES